MHGRLVLRMVVAAAIACMLPTGANATRWVLIGQTDAAVRYIDADAVVRDEAVATIWLKTEYTSKGEKGESFKIEKWMHDCATSRAKLLALTLYKANGSVIISGEIPRYRQEWDTIVTDSVGEGVHRRVCGINDERPDGRDHEGSTSLDVT